MKRSESKCVEKNDCSTEKDIVKLFLFCRHRFPKLSRSELRTCFANSTIFVNNVRIRCGHIDECKRLSPGDIVTIDVNTLVEDQNHIKSISLNVLHQQPGMVIVQKPSGIRKNDIEKACQQRLFDGENKTDEKKTEIQFVWHLEKGLGGLVIVAESTSHLLHLRQLLADGMLLVHYTCVISGYVGDVGTIATIPTTHQGWPTMDLEILRTAQCRKCGVISHVRIHVSFDSKELSNASTGTPSISYSDRMTMLRYPTARVKSIRRALQSSGHIVVGDGGAIKSNKGLYASVSSIQLLSRPKAIDTMAESIHHRKTDHSIEEMDSVDWIGFEPVSVMLDEPKKFSTLMDKEHFLYDLAQKKQEALLHAWSIRQSIGNDNMEVPMRKVWVGSKEEQSNVPERFVSMKHEQGDANQEDRNEDSDMDDNDSDTNSAHDNVEEEEEAEENNGMPSLQEMQRLLSEGMPVEYILGESTFCGLTLLITQDVMIPKKSSEVLVQRALRCLQCWKEKKNDEMTRIADQRDTHNSNDNNREKGDKETTEDTDDDDICVLDIGTGSGCLLLSILHHYLHSDGGGGGGGDDDDDDDDDDHCCEGSSVSTKIDTNIKDLQKTITGVGIDLSSSALAIAHRNAQAMKLDHIASFRIMDFSDLIPLMVDASHDAVIARKASTTRTGRFDIIICNPPYSSLREQRLSTTSREYEPALALYASDKEGASGPLGAYRTLANAFFAVEHQYQQSLIHDMDKSLSSSSTPKLQHLFNTNAKIIFEVGCGQDLQVQQIFTKCHMFLRFHDSYKDHKGIVRCLEYQYVTSK